MEVSTIEMDPELAQQRLEAYRSSLKRRSDEEYEAAAKGYEALVAGTPLLNVPDAIRNSPFDEKHRPRLAIARADREQVTFDWPPYSEVVRFDTTRTWHPPASLLVEINLFQTNPTQRRIRGHSLVPMVPPEILKLAGGKSGLRRHFILWEVEAWADKPILAVPDRDPLLLRHLHGDLYAIIGAWDLTELERAVMAGRR